MPYENGPSPVNFPKVIGWLMFTAGVVALAYLLGLKVAMAVVAVAIGHDLHRNG